MTIDSIAPVATALSAREKKNIRTTLLADLEDARQLELRLKADVAAGIASRRGSTTDEVDDPEGANTAFEGAQSSAMVRLTAQHIAEIDAALLRLDSDAYGSCEKCGSEIPLPRLSARPIARFCMACAE